MLRAVKIRLYPNKEQATQINKLLGCYRVVYNQCLARKIKSYEENKVSENLSTLGKFIHHELLKDDNFIWLREQNTKVLKQAVQYSQFKTMFGDLLQIYVQREVMPKIKKLIKQQVMDHLTIDIDEQWEPYSGQEHPYLDGSVKWHE